MLGLTPHRSTVDRIATLKLILQRRHEFREPCLVAYVDFRSAFDSVDRPALWLLLKSRADGVQSDWFPFSAGVRQGCNIAPGLLEPMDWVMDRTVHRGFAGVSIGIVKSL